MDVAKFNERIMGPAHVENVMNLACRNPEYGCDLHPIDFALFAEACGGTGVTIEDPAECGDVLDAALAGPGPVIVQGVVDPLEPPLPAKTTLKQMAHFAESLIRGEPNRERIALTVLADRVRELI